MRIGLVFITSAVVRQTGGSGTRSHEISFSKAIDEAVEPGDTVVRFFPTRRPRRFIPNSRPDPDSVSQVGYAMNFWDRFYHYRERTSAMAKLVRRFRLSGFEKLLTVHEIDLAIFASPNPALLSLEQTPFVSTVWDIGHRQLPHFTEMSGSGGQWHEREFYFRIALNRGVATLTDSETTSQNLASNFGVDLSKAKAIGLAAERHEVLEVPANLGFVAKRLSKDPFFYYPANWWPHKNHQVLIEAMKLLFDRDISASLVFSGNPNVGVAGYRQRMMLLAEHLQLNENLLFLESVDDISNHWLLQNCIGLCMPSLLGPTNIPPLEASSYSKALGLSNVHTMTEAIRHAIFLDPRSPEEWSNFMEAVLNGEGRTTFPNPRQTLNVEAIREVLDQARYDIELIAGKQEYL